MVWFEFQANAPVKADPHYPDSYCLRHMLLTQARVFLGVEAVSSLRRPHSGEKMMDLGSGPEMHGPQHWPRPTGLTPRAGR
jgi:hypothetical protein